MALKKLQVQPLLCCFAILIFLNGCAGNELYLSSKNTTLSDGHVLANSFLPNAETNSADTLKFGSEIKNLERYFSAMKSAPASADPIVRGLGAFDKKDYEEANFYIQHALKSDLQNPHLHKLNAMSYHFRGDQGDTSQYELADVGYQLAARMDPGDSTISFYQGVLKFSEGKYKSAQDFFAKAIIMNSMTAEYYYGLAASSYYLGETERAYLNIRKAKELAPADESNKRAGSIILASMGATDKAETEAGKLGQLEKSGFSKNRLLSSRISDWKHFFQSNGIHKDTSYQQLMAQNTDIFGVPKTGIFEDNSDTTTDQTNRSGSSASLASASSETSIPKLKVPKMALVDVVIIRTEEIYKSTKGVNLLNGLNLFFSRPTDDNILQMELGTTSGSGLTYSLNIFNDNYDRNEIIARPTIVVQDTEVSTFFSGGTTHVVLQGGTSGPGSVEAIDDGVKLQVKPKFLDPETIEISVVAERTNLESSVASVSSILTGTSVARTSKTKINANLTLRYGETMVLSGLSDQFKDTLDDKTPGLGDVPVAQYLFRNNVEYTQNKTVLILLTPRRNTVTLADGTPIQGDVNASSTNLQELEKSKSWLNADNNLRAIVTHLKRYKFFNQYRKGDIRLETWSSDAWRSNALEKALEYLYIKYDFGVSGLSEVGVGVQG